MTPNRTMTGYATGAGNRLTNDGVYTYTYDDEGNLTKKSKGASAETWTYTYDNRNQMVGVTERSTDGGGTLLFQATYTYDVFNNRVKAEEYVNGSGTTTIKSAYADEGTVFADLDNANAMQTRYLREDDSQYSPVVARIDSGGNAAWLYGDRLGSTRNVVNGSGTLIGTVAYDGFGGIASESSPSSTGIYAYAGYRRDKQLGTYHPDGSARPVYDPAIGRWYNPDPAGDVDGPNRYLYVRNNSTNGVDPSGLMLFAVGESEAKRWLSYLTQEPGLGIKAGIRAIQVDSSGRWQIEIFGTNTDMQVARQAILKRYQQIRLLDRDNYGFEQNMLEGLLYADVRYLISKSGGAWIITL